MADDFYLDLRNMDAVIAEVQNLAGRTEDLRGEFQQTLTNASYGWYGQSRTMFDKKAHMLMQQITDVSQALYDVGENLLNASKAYMEADMQLAKQTDGIQEDRF